MAFTVFQAGSTLYGMDQRGSRVALTLPTSITLDPTLRPRFAVLGNFAIMVNSPNRPITIDANLNVRVLCPMPPAAKPTIAGGSAGSLSGTYQVRQTFKVYDLFGNLIAESDFGPTADAVTIVSKKLSVTGISLSTDTVSAASLYRTATGQAVYFPWLNLDGNTQTAIEDDLSDAGLGTLAAPALGTPPNLSLIAEFRSRLFGVSKDNPNYIRYSDVARGYAWPTSFVQPIPRLGSDNRGCTGFIRRRDALGLGRANGLYQFTGTNDTNFRIVNITENAGIEASDSVAVYRDVAFFLWKDGVYRWNTDGLKNVAEGHVSRWFTRNGTFNLARLKYAFAHIDPLRKRYRLFLASAGSAIENCWIEYDFVNDRWWGPHMSHAFNPSCAFTYQTDSGLSLPIIGGADGKCRLDRKRYTDDDATGIDFDVVTARHDLNDPLMEKYFGELSVAVKPQPSGTMDVYATVGPVNQPRLAKGDKIDEQSPFEADLTQPTQRLGRCGIGETCKLRFRHNKPNQDVCVRGYEINPVNPVGRRS